MNHQRWQQINDLFQAAAELSLDERSGMLEECCAGDESLRLEVESLLASDEQARDFIEEPAIKVAAELLTVNQPGLRAGDHIGSYEVLALIAKGGMGEVFLAQDGKLGRKVALKLLPSVVADNRQRSRRFLQEAHALSALNHPNIIVVHDAVFEGDTHYIVTEFVDGQTLRQRLIESRLTVSEALRIVIQVGSALEVAHQAGIIHRDIKPENIMLRADGYVKVLDFGLAKLSETHLSNLFAAAEQQSSLDVYPGRIMGTARYMSPEQARGLPVDARTDIFSLGVVLYEIISGRPPFDGETISDVISQLLTHEPAPLDDSACAGLPELGHVIAKALWKDQAGRYQSMSDFLTDLRRLKRKVGTLAESSEVAGLTFTKPDSPVVKHVMSADSSSALSVNRFPGVRWAVRQGKRRLIIPSALAVVLATVAFYFIASHPNVDGTQAQIQDIAVLPFVMESTDPDAEILADGLTESIIDRLARLPKIRVIARNSVFRYKRQEINVQAIGRALDVQAVLTGKIIQRDDTLFLHVELLDARNNKQLWEEHFEQKNNDVLALQNDLTKSIVEKLEIRLSRDEQQRIMKRYTDNVQAYKLYVKGRFYWNKPTADDIKHAIEHFSQAITEDPSYALAYAGMAQSYSLLAANHSYPPETIPLAKAYAKKAIELDDALDEAHYAVGLNNYLFDWNWSVAEKELKHTLELNPGHAAARHSYGGLLRAFGRMDESIAEIRRALDQDPLSLRIRFSLGLSYYYTHQYHEAIKEFRIALQMDQGAFTAHVHMGRCFTALRQFEDALAAINKGREHAPTSTWALASLGQAYAAAGKRGEARRVLAELRQLSTKAYIRPYEIALIYAALGENDQALEWLGRAYEERSPFLLFMRFEPLLDNLHSDDRFQALSRRIGLN